MSWNNHFPKNTFYGNQSKSRPADECKTVPLSDLKPGRFGVLVGIDGGSPAGRREFEMLGLHRFSFVRVVSNDNRHLIIEAAGKRIAMDRFAAREMTVLLLEEGGGQGGADLEWEFSGGRRSGR